MKSNWEDVVISLINQLAILEKDLKTQTKFITNYSEHHLSPELVNILIESQKHTQDSFRSMEDKIHDMIIYLCRAMTETRMPELRNLLGDNNYGMEQ